MKNPGPWGAHVKQTGFHVKRNIPTRKGIGPAARVNERLVRHWRQRRGLGEAERIPRRGMQFSRVVGGPWQVRGRKPVDGARLRPAAKHRFFGTCVPTEEKGQILDERILLHVN